MLRFTFVVTFIFLSNVAFGSESLQDQIDQCSLIKKNKKRLNCFDQLSTKASATTDKSIAPKETSSQTEQLPDNLGGADFSKGKEPKSYAGKVVSCKAAHDRKWFYFFENGQVWKQVDRRRIRHKTCEFEVAIKKDGLGYVMYYDQNRKVRIKRKR